mmetsp:Transcript_11728/g.19553  ORF Transcript_11728/g.19553 Transcript_11728/m.19553 type:complete len:158 (+) Transcript_11728:18-491(+)
MGKRPPRDKLNDSWSYPDDVDPKSNINIDDKDVLKPTDGVVTEKTQQDIRKAVKNMDLTQEDKQDLKVMKWSAPISMGPALFGMLGSIYYVRKTWMKRPALMNFSILSITGIASVAWFHIVTQNYILPTHNRLMSRNTDFAKAYQRQVQSTSQRRPE